MALRSVTIDECTEGYLVKEGGSFKTYAVSRDKLVQKVKELFGITDKSRTVALGGTMIEQLKSNPELLISDVSDLTSAKLAINNRIPPIPLLPDFIFTEIGSFEVSVQPITKNRAIYWLHPGGKKIRITRDGYTSILIHANISDLVYLYEHPAEQKALFKAYGKSTYENKAVILRGFLKDVPLSALVGDAHHDEAITAKKDEPKGQEDGSCDDVAFESCANNTPEQCKYCIDQSRYENKNKLAAKKPSPPLMKASVSP